MRNMPLDQRLLTCMPIKLSWLYAGILSRKAPADNPFSTSPCNPPLCYLKWGNSDRLYAHVTTASDQWRILLFFLQHCVAILQGRKHYTSCIGRRWQNGHKIPWPGKLSDQWSGGDPSLHPGQLLSAQSLTILAILLLNRCSKFALL